MLLAELRGEGGAGGLLLPAPPLPPTSGPVLRRPVPAGPLGETVAGVEDALNPDPALGAAAVPAASTRWRRLLVAVSGPPGASLGAGGSWALGPSAGWCPGGVRPLGGWGSGRSGTAGQGQVCGAGPAVGLQALLSARSPPRPRSPRPPELRLLLEGLFPLM